MAGRPLQSADMITAKRDGERTILIGHVFWTILYSEMFSLHHFFLVGIQPLITFTLTTALGPEFSPRLNEDFSSVVCPLVQLETATVWFAPFLKSKPRPHGTESDKESTIPPGNNGRWLQCAVRGIFNQVATKQFRIENNSVNTIIFVFLFVFFSRKERLFSFCRCAGSLAMAHRSCLEKWLSTSNSSTCEICKFGFQTTRRPRSAVDVSCSVHRRRISERFSTRNNSTELATSDLPASIVFFTKTAVRPSVLMPLCWISYLWGA